MRRGLAVAALHIAIVLSMAGKYAWDRDRLPRAWARTINFDPNLPLRGRYVNLWVVVPVAVSDPLATRVQLSVRDGALEGKMGQTGLPFFLRDSQIVLAARLAFFIPEHAQDPSRLQPGEELWVELSVPPRGQPRPVRLGVRKDNVLTPLQPR